MRLRFEFYFVASWLAFALPKPVTEGEHGGTYDWMQLK